MISVTAPIAVSERSIAPSTASSASRFCGGTAAVGEGVRRAHGAASNPSRRDVSRRAAISAAAAGKQNTCSYHIPRPDAVLHRGAPELPRRNPARSGEFSAPLHRRCGAPVENCRRTRRRPRRPPPRSVRLGSASALGSARVARRRELGSASASTSTSTSSRSSSSASAASVARTASSWARAGRLGLGPLGRLHRGELLLRRQLAALGHDERLHLGGDALEHVHRHGEAADRA